MLEDELMARDHWSREDLLAYQRQRVRTGPAFGHPLALLSRGLGADAVEQPLPSCPACEGDTDGRVRPDRPVPAAAGRPAGTLPVQTRAVLPRAYRIATTSGTTGRRSSSRSPRRGRRVAGPARPIMRMGIGLGPRSRRWQLSPVHVTRQSGPAWHADAPESAATPVPHCSALNAQQPEILIGAAGIWRTLAEAIAGRLRIAPPRLSSAASR